MLAALALWLDYRQNTVFPCVHLFDWESDMLVITKSRLVWEIEVKISLADWRADLKKAKWKHRHWPYISQFMYAVPFTLLESTEMQAPNWWSGGKLWTYKVPEFVPEWAGVIAVGNLPGKTGMQVQEVRKAKRLAKNRIDEPRLLRLYRSTYYRFWEQRPHFSAGTAAIDCRDSIRLAEIEDGDQSDESQRSVGRS